MVHTMRLRPHFFEKIIDQKKTIEIRLADEKRKRCHVGDTIVFYELPQCDKQVVVVVDQIEQYLSYEQLLRQNDVRSFGITDYEVDAFLQELQNIYPKQAVNECGLLGIHFHVSQNER